MQYNQAFCGNGFTNGPVCSPHSAPFNSTQSMYPEIVGEGQITSVTLADGSVQFFFMPTLKWWSPNATQCQPYPTIPNPMFANTYYSIPPPCNNNVGTWFIRSISSPFPPRQRNELLGLDNIRDCNHKLNSLDFGYQAKFHNDGWTSTTDLVYFYPSLRQRDFVFTLPCKDKTVQTDTELVANNTVCNYEVICTKPCNCSVGPKPMSLDCLVDPKLTPKSNNISTDDSCCSKKYKKRVMVQKKKRNKSKNIICACGSATNIASVDKSITTYADEGSSCTPADGRETQTCKSDESKCVDAKPMTQSLLKPALRETKWPTEGNSGCSTTDECSTEDTSKVANKRDKDKEYRQSRPKKCDCDSDSSANSVCSVSEDETVSNAPCICSSCSSITMLKTSKRRSKDAAQRTTSVQNSFKSENCVYEKCEPKGEETWQPSVNPLCERREAMKIKSLEDLLEI